MWGRFGTIKESAERVGVFYDGELLYAESVLAGSRFGVFW
jgi:hypothetical protein